MLSVRRLRWESVSYIFGDNMSVINNTRKPESTLKKKSNAICYHAVREAVAMGDLPDAAIMPPG